MAAFDPRTPAAMPAVMAGALDLSSLATPRPTPGTAAPAAAGGVVTVVDVTEATFQAEVIQRSAQVPVVLDFWAEWCGPCKQLSPVLEKLAAEGGGAWVLAKIDVDTNQRLAEAAQVQGIPSVKVVIAGQIAGEFTGAIPEAQARQWIGEVLAVAQEAGLPGLAPTTEDGEPAPPPVDPMIAQAEDCLVAGDLMGAAAAYQARLDVAPADAEARSGLARVGLFSRVEGVTDPAVVIAAADAAPDDVAAQTLAADVQLVDGDVQGALDRLVATVRRVFGDDRDTVRLHLLELFEVLDPSDEIVAKARRSLSAALF